MTFWETALAAACGYLGARALAAVVLTVIKDWMRSRGLRWR